MHAKNKQDRSRKLPIILTVIGPVLAAGVVSGFIFQDTLKTFIADTKANVDNRGKPVFAFNDAKFPDWADTGNTWSDGTDGEAPITTMLITQCTPGSHCGELVDQCKSTRGKGSQCKKLERDTADGCMIELYYMRHAVDPDTAVADKLKRDTSFKGITVREIGVKTLSMNTPGGVRQYQLHQYDIGRAYEVSEEREVMGENDDLALAGERRDSLRDLLPTTVQTVIAEISLTWAINGPVAEES